MVPRLPWISFGGQSQWSVQRRPTAHRSHLTAASVSCEYEEGGQHFYKLQGLLARHALCYYDFWVGRGISDKLIEQTIPDF